MLAQRFPKPAELEMQISIFYYNVSLYIMQVFYLRYRKILQDQVAPSQMGYAWDSLFSAVMLSHPSDWVQFGTKVFFCTLDKKPAL